MLHTDQGSHVGSNPGCGQIGQLNGTTRDIYCYGSNWPSSGGGNIGYWADYILVAVGGSHGTLSEIAFALKRGKPVAGIGSWEVDPQVRAVATPEEAVSHILSR